MARSTTRLQGALLVFLLAGLFLTTLSASSVLQGKRDPLGLVEGRKDAGGPPAPPQDDESFVSLSTRADALEPAAPARELPDLTIRVESHYECVATDGGLPGWATVRVVNAGPGATGGFLAWIETTVTNTVDGSQSKHRFDQWQADLGAGSALEFDLRYGFPTPASATTIPATPLAGSWTVAVTVDLPSDEMSFFGEEGILPEASESNNRAEYATNGIASGAC